MHRNPNHHSYSLPKPYASLTLPQKFPEDIQCIIQSPHPTRGSLYISNIEAAENLTTLKKLGIRAILTCAKGYELKHPPSEIPDYKYIPTVDHDGCNISVHFDEAVSFIKEELAKTNLLVHCIAGVSRSVSMVIAYLISENNMNYDEAYRLVKSRRKIICPNDGFIKQLKEYHTKQKSISRASTSPKTTPKMEPELALTPAKTPTLDQDQPFLKYQSTYLTPYSKTNYFPLEHTQSIQLQKPKAEYQRQQTPGPQRRKDQGKYAANTAASYFSTDGKNGEVGRFEYLEKSSGNQRKTPVSQKLIKAELTPNKEEDKAATPTKTGVGQIPKESMVQSQTKMRKGYFENMNKELSDRIESIRLKYDKERQKIFEKYQLTDKKIEKSPQKVSINPHDQQERNKREVSPNKHSLNGVSTVREQVGQQYEEVKQYFSKNRMSYAQIYDRYSKGQREEGKASQRDYYLKYNYDLDRSWVGKGRERPYSQYDRYGNRAYKDYFNYQGGYSYGQY